ncbi:MAG: threonylcarbamoyl-AMP synthase [Candidatus Aenigmarchaeota archaeon]|nr:threonylcarbamoyl-AMP synthase [Candidatus Aenigmarchaeota archaeon]
MRILKINPNKPEKKLTALAVDILKGDGLVVYPTDTLYGIAGNALSKKAILRVYSAKGRNFKKPLSIAFHSLSQAKKYVRFNPLALRLAKIFLPGPLTIVLPMRYKFPKELTGSRNVGIRIPDNKISLELIEKFGYPITATSANTSGNADPITAKDAIVQIGDKVDLVLDGGKCKLKKPSTVIEVIDDKIKVLRRGVVSQKALMK